MFAGNFAPRGWMYCWGQTLQITQYTALYSILGISFGGDGRSTFALPDLRGRVPLGMGQQPGSPNVYNFGQHGGAEYIQLTQAQLPMHTHTATFTPTGSVPGTPISASVTVNAGTGGTQTADPTGAYWGKSPSTGPTQSFDYTNQKNVTMASDAVQVNITGGGGGITGGSVINAVAGSGQPYLNLQPYQVLNYIICVNGMFPSRN